MFLLVFLLVIMVPVRANAVEVETLQHDPFGSVEIFRSDLSEKGIVVFVSGADGWTGALTGLAKAMADLDYLVVGVDLRAWRLTPGQPLNACTHLDRELERLARGMALRYHLPQQSPPILIGYGAGAAAVYISGDGGWAAFDRGVADVLRQRDWLGGGRQDGVETQAGVAAIPWADRLCLYGDQEKDSACPLVAKLGVSIQALPGTHHLGDDYAQIVEHILARTKTTREH